MFTKKTQTEPSALDEVINDALSVLNDHVAGSPEYGRALDHVSKLYSLKDPTIPSGITPDTKAMVFANLAGILIIVAYESKNVVTSKALGFIGKALH